MQKMFTACWKRVMGKLWCHYSPADQQGANTHTHTHTRTHTHTHTRIHHLQVMGTAIHTLVILWPNKIHSHLRPVSWPRAGPSPLRHQGAGYMRKEGRWLHKLFFVVAAGRLQARAWRGSCLLRLDNSNARDNNAGVCVCVSLYLPEMCHCSHAYTLWEKSQYDKVLTRLRCTSVSKLTGEGPLRPRAPFKGPARWEKGVYLYDVEYMIYSAVPRRRGLLVFFLLRGPRAKRSSTWFTALPRRCRNVT